jgi:hypothetical protein
MELTAAIDTRMTLAQAIVGNVLDFQKEKARADKKEKNNCILHYTFVSSDDRHANDSCISIGNNCRMSSRRP